MALLSAAAEGIKDWTIGIWRQIHDNPEGGAVQTGELVKATLKKLQVYVYEHDSTHPYTGVVGRIGSGTAPFVALRADMDALPLQEVYEWKHKSKVDGGMHASGYGAQTTMLLGAAKLLQAQYQNKEFQGTVFLLFHPSKEENAGASMSTLADGVLKECPVVFGLQLTDALPVGTWATKVDTAMAGFNVRIDGAAGPGDGSRKTIDPAAARASIISSLQLTISQEMDPNDSQGSTTTMEFLNGDSDDDNSPDESPYIRGMIPHTVSVEGIKQKIMQVVKEQAMEHGCTATVEFDPKQTVINSNEALEFLRGVVSEATGGGTISDDFNFQSSHIMQGMHGATFITGCAAAAASSNEEKLLFDQTDLPKIFPVGGAVITAAVNKYFLGNTFRFIHNIL